MLLDDDSHPKMQCVNFLLALTEYYKFRFCRKYYTRLPFLVYSRYIVFKHVVPNIANLSCCYYCSKPILYFLLSVVSYSFPFQMHLTFAVQIFQSISCQFTPTCSSVLCSQFKAILTATHASLFMHCMWGRNVCDSFYLRQPTFVNKQL